ncbi:cell wall hydrolase [Loktanella sp. SALINAS62]|uniref:cell wall hydrolase n=1 Tax=Loktanella sp. SALINAS62 TaxID=2706124 RepID=UPI001B8B3DE8|nr:cell wall hydrolase [Loktanella sp. SALINAS62]MBS1302994.1 cell wall hydrolase [Loktanella sp. SALINAS62]
MTHLFRTAVTAAIVAITCTTSAAADEVLAARLGALLGEEREALAMVPDTRLSALTALPESARRDASPLPDGDTAVSEAFISTMTAPSGGSEWQCLSEALYHEARGEDIMGVFAVGEVIMNRVDSGSYPNSICGVVHQGTGRKYACQFTWTCDGHSDAIGNRTAFSRVGKVAKLLIDGLPRRLTQGATHYHTRAVNPSWAQRFPRVASFGAHHFYRQPTRQASR